MLDRYTKLHNDNRNSAIDQDRPDAPLLVAVLYLPEKDAAWHTQATTPTSRNKSHQIILRLQSDFLSSYTNADFLNDYDEKSIVWGK